MPNPGDCFSVVCATLLLLLCMYIYIREPLPDIPNDRNGRVTKEFPIALERAENLRETRERAIKFNVRVTKA